MQIEDLEGSIEAMVFSTQYDRLSPSLNEDKAVLIRGLVLPEENAPPKISVQDIVRWEQGNGPIPLGAIVMARTGWGSRWNSVKKYRNPDAKGGMHFPGYSEDAARFLSDGLAEQESLPEDAAGWDEVAAGLVQRTKAAGRFVPGLGHPVHRVEDPRTPVLFALARQQGTFGPHLELFAAIGRVHPQVLGRTLPLNGAGTCGAVLADLDLPVSVMRGFALLARCAGLLGHLAEEEADPIGMEIYLSVDRNIDYRPPVG
jgi:hypothetical protein